MSKTEGNVQVLSKQFQPFIEISALSKTAPINPSQVKESKKSRKQKKTKKVTLKKGQWSSQEDKLLEQWVRENGPKNWEACGKFIQGRRGKQCREHWSNCLNPDLKKGNWTPEEDFLIMFFYEKCEGSWKKIIPLFNGRTENSIKNRFFSELRKYAYKDIESEEEKKLISKKKLDELKNYLSQALNQAKKYLFEKTEMTQEKFILFIKENEQKLKDNVLDIDSENNESTLSTNLGASLFEDELTKNNFIRKRKRDEKIEKNNQDNNIKQKEKDFSFEEKKFKGILEENGLNLDENKQDIFKKDISPDNYYGTIYNNYYNNDNYNIREISLNNEEDGQDEMSIDSFEFTQNNFLRDIFKEYNYNIYLGANNLDNTKNGIIDEKNFEFAFNSNNFLEE